MNWSYLYSALTDITVFYRGSLAPLSKDCFTISSAEDSSRSAFPVSDEQDNVIAICLVIVDELHHEEIWRNWIEDKQGEGEGASDRNRSDKEQQQWKRRCTESSGGSSSSSSKSTETNTDAERQGQGQNHFRNLIKDSKYRARLFIHAKHPDRVKSSWVRERMLGAVLIIVMMIMIMMTVIFHRCWKKLIS